MSYIGISDISDYTGDDYSGEETTMQLVIDAVCLYVATYCDQVFDDGVYAERIHIIDNLFSLQNNVQYIYGTYSGIFTAMEVTPPSAISSIRVSEDMKTLSLLSTFTKTDIDIEALTLTGVVSAINTESGWSATIDENIDNVYAMTLYPGTYNCDINDSNIIKPLCANMHLSCSQLTNNLIQTDYTCSEGVCVYRGGFNPVPADLMDATVRMCIRAFNNKSVALSGNVKSEKVGDYSYTLFNGNEESTGVDIDYFSVLNSYRRLSI